MQSTHYGPLCENFIFNFLVLLSRNLNTAAKRFFNCSSFFISWKSRWLNYYYFQHQAQFSCERSKKMQIEFMLIFHSCLNLYVYRAEGRRVSWSTIAIIIGAHDDNNNNQEEAIWHLKTNFKSLKLIKKLFTFNFSPQFRVLGNFLIFTWTTIC